MDDGSLFLHVIFGSGMAGFFMPSIIVKYNTKKQKEIAELEEELKRLEDGIS